MVKNGNVEMIRWIVDGKMQDCVALFRDATKYAHQPWSSKGPEDPPSLLETDKPQDWRVNRRMHVPTGHSLGRWAKSFNSNLDRAPNGLAGPWYIPADEYAEWEGLLGTSPRIIADHARFGLDHLDVAAVRNARCGIRSGRRIHSMVEGWKMHTPSGRHPFSTSTPEGSAEVTKLVQRMHYFHKGFWDESYDSLSGHGSEPNPYTMQLVAQITDLIADALGIEERFTEESRLVFSLVSSTFQHRAMEGVRFGDDSFIRHLDMGPDEGETDWSDYGTKNDLIERGVGALRMGSHLDFEVLKSLLPYMAPHLVCLKEVQLTNCMVARVALPSRDPGYVPMPVSAISGIKDDDEADALLTLLVNGVLTEPAPVLPAGDWDSVIEMVRSEVPAEWILSSMFSPVGVRWGL